jgi:Rod binding domain-containing protein
VSATGFPSSTASVATQDLNSGRGEQAARLLKSQGKDGDLAKIDKAARDFESILLGEWLEKAEKSFATVPGQSDENTDPGHDQFQSIGCQFLAESLSKSGGIGIAAMISKHLKAVEEQRNTGETEDSSSPPSEAKKL